jgi:hypothetical protein
MTQPLHFQQIHNALFPSAQSTQEVSCKNSESGGSKKTWILTGGKFRAESAQLRYCPFHKIAQFPERGPSSCLSRQSSKIPESLILSCSVGSKRNTTWAGLHQQKTFCLGAGGRQVGRHEVLGTKPGFPSVVFC